MSSFLETFALVFFALTLGLIIMVIMILSKEWTQHKARQFWPKLSSANALDLELGFGDLMGLIWRVERLERFIGVDDQLAEYHD